MDLFLHLYVERSCSSGHVLARHLLSAAMCQYVAEQKDGNFVRPHRVYLRRQVHLRAQTFEKEYQLNVKHGNGMFRGLWSHFGGEKNTLRSVPGTNDDVFTVDQSRIEFG